MRIEDKHLYRISRLILQARTAINNAVDEMTDIFNAPPVESAPPPERAYSAHTETSGIMKPRRVNRKQKRRWK